MNNHPIVAGFANLGNQIAGVLHRTFGTVLDNAEESHWLVMVDTSDLDAGYVDLGANATGVGVFQIGADADFVATAIMRRAPTQASVTAADQPFTFQLRDGSTSRDLSNVEVHADIGMGDGQFPNNLP